MEKRNKPQTQNRFLKTSREALKKRPAAARQSQLGSGAHEKQLINDLLKVRLWWRVCEKRAVESLARGEDV